MKAILLMGLMRQLACFQVNFAEGFLTTPADNYQNNVLKAANATAIVFVSDNSLLVRRLTCPGEA